MLKVKFWSLTANVNSFHCMPKTNKACQQLTASAVVVYLTHESRLIRDNLVQCDGNVLNVTPD